MSGSANARPWFTTAGWEDTSLIVRTKDLEEAGRAIAKVYNPYQFATLQSGNSGPAQMYSLESESVGVSCFAYGVPIEIRPRAFEDFYLILTTVCGAAEISDDRAAFSGTEGMTVMASPERRWRFRYSQDNV